MYREIYIDTLMIRTLEGHVVSIPTIFPLKGPWPGP